MEALETQIKQLIIEALLFEDMSADDLDADQPLFGGDLDLDSVDALEIAVEIERVFGVRIPEKGEGREAFTSVRTLAAYVAAHRAEG